MFFFLQYALESHIKFHGYPVDTALIETQPRPGDNTPETEDVLNIIEKEGDSIALVFMEAVNFYTGQLFDISKITKAARSKVSRFTFLQACFFYA
jgi:kynureninase